MNTNFFFSYLSTGNFLVIERNVFDLRVRGKISRVQLYTVENYIIYM